MHLIAKDSITTRIPDERFTSQLKQSLLYVHLITRVDKNSHGYLRGSSLFKSAFI